MKMIQQLADFIDRGCRYVSVALLMSMTVVFFTQICMRYLFGNGLSWAEELSRYMMVWLIYICAIVVFREGTQISVTAIEDKLPNAWRFTLNIAQKVVCIVFFLMVGYLGIKIMPFASFQKSPNMQIPMKYMYMLFPIASWLIVLQLIANFIRDFGRDHD
jgi:TRAP-type C4-dicarboxylate transport system permease small subunit